MIDSSLSKHILYTDFYKTIFSTGLHVGFTEWDKAKEILVGR